MASKPKKPAVINSKKLKVVPRDDEKTIPFEAALSAGKKIVAEAARHERNSGLELGQLAASVETKYGDRTLAKLAEGIGVASFTLARHLSVYRAWKDIKAPGPVSYSVMRELQDHPNRLALVTDDPRMTKAAAREHVREFEGKALAAAKARGFEGDTKRWFDDVSVFANGFTQAAEALTPAQLEHLRPVAEPPLLLTLRRAGAALQELADRLEREVVLQAAE